MGASGISFTEAVWLWKNATIGRCYDPADQILHGGNVFNGHSIKGYTPGNISIVSAYTPYFTRYLNLI